MAANLNHLTAYGSFLFAFFYGVHPILTPVVAWIPGRNDSLITIFILLASIAVIYLYDSKNKILQYLFLLLHFSVQVTLGNYSTVSVRRLSASSTEQFS